MTLTQKLARIEVLRSTIDANWGNCQSIPEVIAEFRQLQIEVAMERGY